MDSSARFQLMNAFTRLKKARKLMHPDMLHPPEFFILEHLQKNTCGTSVSQLNFGMSKPAVSQILNSLEKKGYIGRSISPEDRRKVEVNLTPAGETALVNAKQHFEYAIDTLIERLGEKDFQELLRLMSRLNEIIDDIHKEDEK